MPSFSSNLANREPHTPKTKFYSSDEVKALIESLIAPKVKVLTQELYDKQLVINALNERLNENDTRLESQRKVIQSLLQVRQQHTAHNIHALINDKLKRVWDALAQKLK